MPFPPRRVPTLRLLPAALCALALGTAACTAGGEATITPAAADGAAPAARLATLRARLAAAPCEPAALGELAALADASPAVDPAGPYDLARQTFESCRAWERLAEVLESKPAAARSVDETVDLARLDILYLRRFAEGEALVRPLLAEDPDNVDYVGLLTSALYYQDRVVEAGPHVDRVWDAVVRARNADIMAMRAQAFHQAGNSARALRILEQARAMQPAHVLTLTVLGQVLAATGEEAMAQAVADEAARIRQANDAQIARATRIDDLIKVLNDAWHEGRYLDVERTAEELLAAGLPRDRQPDLYRMLGETYEALGRGAEAADARATAEAIAGSLGAGAP